MTTILLTLSSPNTFLPNPGIYCIINSLNGKKYVGQSNNVRRRFSEHRMLKAVSSTNLGKAFQKYGVEHFSFAVYDYCTLEQLDSREQLYIKELVPEYNMSEAGKGNRGHIVSEETKAKLSEKGKAAWKQKPDCVKQRIICNNLKGPECGHVVSESTRRKLHLANIGKTQSNETLIKRAASNKIALLGNTNGNKHVLQIIGHTTVDWPSIKAAARSLNIHPSNITKVIRGTQKTAGGFSWKLKKDNGTN